MWYADEAEIHLNPHLTRMWMRRGSQVRIPTPGQNKKQTVIGGMNALTGDFEYLLPQKKNSDGFLDFVQALVAKAQRRRIRIQLVLDNGPIHKSKKVMDFLNRKDVRRYLKIIWLPPYSPELNLIERLWGHVKRTLVANKLFSSFEKLVEALRTGLESLKHAQKEVQFVVGAAA
jgi:transposase